MTDQIMSPTVPGRRQIAPRLVSVVGRSGAGKTTFLEKLVRILRRRGHRVGTIKHSLHGFDIDHVGKDTWRHEQAGALTVAISSPNKLAVIREVVKEESLDDLAETYFSDMDLILTEGYKKENKPKIEVFRGKTGKQPLCMEDPNLMAVASDVSLDLDVPCFGLEDIEGIADLVEKSFLCP